MQTVVPGAQLAPHGGDVGAICCFARARKGGGVHAITAGHVANCWATLPTGTTIWHPEFNGSGSLLLGSCAVRPTLPTWRQAPDCAAIQLDANVRRSVNLPGTPPGYALAVPDMRIPVRGQAVAKLGPESGLTLGTAATILSPVKVRAPAPYSGTITLQRALLVKADRGQFSLEGDSGAPVFRVNDGTLIGMIIGGAWGRRYRGASIVMLVTDILNAVDMDFAT